MIANLNLATQPFRNRTLPWIVTAVTMSLSLGALIYFISETRGVNNQTAAVEREVKTLSGQRDVLQRQAAQVKEALAPDQVQLLQSTHLLVNRKRFSWSRLFAELETAMPTNVRATRLAVRDVLQSGDQTFADLDLTVVGRTPTDVTQMGDNMNRNGVFVAQLLSENLRVGKGEGGTEWTLRVRYTPRQGEPSDISSTNTAAAPATTPVTTAAATAATAPVADTTKTASSSVASSRKEATQQ